MWACASAWVMRTTGAVPRVSGIQGPYWFYFYSFDCGEPMHVHVRREKSEAKFWLDSVAMAWNRGFSPRELIQIERIIIESEPLLIKAWHEHCDPDGNEDSPR